MSFNHQKILVSFFVLWVMFSCQGDRARITTPDGTIEMSQEEFLGLMGEAYLFGYPLILMDLTKKVITNVETPHPIRALAPVNQLAHYRRFPDHTLTAVVKPNVDTYYSMAWMDLEAEPLVLSVPATDRYYLLPLLDAYSNIFASPGTRTTGTGAQTFLIAGPGWQGNVADGLTLIEAPTQMVWMLGRIQVNSPQDGSTVVKEIQDNMRLVPLSANGQKDYTPPHGTVNNEFEDIIPVKAVRQMDWKVYFQKMAELMVQNPPAVADSSIVNKMARLGLAPGKPFDISTDNLILKTKLNRLPAFIHEKMEERRAQPDRSLLKKGWMTVNKDIGVYGTNYARRAYIDFIALGANIPEDAIYPNCTLDINEQPLDAQKRYRIRFETKELPPVNAFWSLTAYNADEFLVENKLNRYALGDRDDLIYNSDGSLDMYVQHNAPEDQMISNWLPIPQQGAFSLTLRLYWPKDEALNGRWEAPPVIPIE